MLRRGHKKSRKGCTECKQRHVKCDETRPICLLCTMSKRDCSFASQVPKLPPKSLSTSDTRNIPEVQSRTPNDNQIQNEINSPNLNTPTPTSISNPNSPSHPSTNTQDFPLDSPINFNHMELLIHLTLDSSMFNLGVGASQSSLALALTAGLKSPHSLYQLLAFSARHLAFLHPEREAFYLHEAVSLQTQAVSLFSSSWTEVDESNCVAMVLFSTVLAHHLLADTLAKRDSGGLKAWLMYYMQCMEMHRGILTLASRAWPLLLETELEPILSWSDGFNARTPVGDHCQGIKELIDGAEGLEDEDKEAFRSVIRYSQVGFDAIFAEEEEEQGGRHHMIFSWTMLLPPRYTDLLKAKRPEALVLLGYYALLLHYGRNMWQVGDAGEYLMGIIGEYLGPGWDSWLEYPRQMMAESKGQTPVAPDRSRSRPSGWV